MSTRVEPEEVALLAKQYYSGTDPRFNRQKLYSFGNYCGHGAFACCGMSAAFMQMHPRDKWKEIADHITSTSRVILIDELRSHFGWTDREFKLFIKSFDYAAFALNHSEEKGYFFKVIPKSTLNMIIDSLGVPNGLGSHPGDARFVMAAVMARIAGMTHPVDAASVVDFEVELNQFISEK